MNNINIKEIARLLLVSKKAKSVVIKVPYNYNFDEFGIYFPRNLVKNMYLLCIKALASCIRKNWEDDYKRELDSMLNSDFYENIVNFKDTMDIKSICNYESFIGAMDTEKLFKVLISLSNKYKTNYEQAACNFTIMKSILNILYSTYILRTDVLKKKENKAWDILKMII